MITLHASQDKKVLINPIHIILIKESENNHGGSYVDVYHSAAKAPLVVKDSFEEIQMMLQQFYKK